MIPCASAHPRTKRGPRVFGPQGLEILARREHGLRPDRPVTALVVDGTGVAAPPRGRGSPATARSPRSAGWRTATAKEENRREGAHRGARHRRPPTPTTTRRSPSTPTPPMSCFHGVTTVAGPATAASRVAPVRKDDHDFLAGVFASVRGHGPDRAQAPWGGTSSRTLPRVSWKTRARPRLGVKLRLLRWAHSKHPPLGDGRGFDRAGGRRLTRDRGHGASSSPRPWPPAPAGLSSSAAPTHNDIHGRPVPLAPGGEGRAAGRWWTRWASFGFGLDLLPCRPSSISGLVKEDMDYLIEIGPAVAACR